MSDASIKSQSFGEWDATVSTDAEGNQFVNICDENGNVLTNIEDARAVVESLLAAVLWTEEQLLTED